MKKTAAILISLLLCTTLAACGQSRSADEPALTADGTAAEDSEASGETPLTFRITWKGYSGRGEAIQAIVDDYNTEYGQNVTLVNGDEDRETIETLLAGQPDTVFVLPYRYVKYFGNQGALLELNDLFTEEHSLFYDEIWALGSINGKTYGIPWLGHSMCLLYNSRLLENAGIKAESLTSMDSLLEALEALRVRTGVGGLGLVGAGSNDVSWMVNQFVYGFGSSLVSEDGKTVTVNNEKTVKVLELYRDVLGPYAQDGWTEDTAVEVMDAFRNQEIAFEILGIWGVTDIDKNGSPFDVGILPLSNIGLCSEVGPLMLSVPAGIGEQGKATAIRFIHYMISMQAQEAILKGEYSPEHDAYYPFRTPIRVDMAESQMIKDHPEYQIFIEGFANPSVDVPVPAWQLVKDEVYEPGLHQVMTGEVSISAFLEAVEIRGNEILQGQ